MRKCLFFSLPGGGAVVSCFSVSGGYNPLASVENPGGGSWEEGGGGALRCRVCDRECLGRAEKGGREENKSAIEPPIPAINSLI